MGQEIIIGLLFAAALFFLARLVYKAFTQKEGCASGCSSCSSVDIQEIAKKMEGDKRFIKK